MQVNSTVSSGSSGSGSESSGAGYVKDTVTFIITDGLEISPSSTITSINLLNKLNVKDLSDLAERNVSVGPNEVRSYYTRWFIVSLLFIVLLNR